MASSPHLTEAASAPTGHGDCLSCAARLVGLCAPLDAATLDAVAALSTRVAVRSRQSIFLQGDPASHVYVLMSGSARLTRLLPDGRRSAIGFRAAGDMLGFTPAQDYPFGAEGLGAAQLCRLERRRLDAVIREHSAVEHRLLGLCMQELAAAQEQVMSLGRFSAEERVAAFLISLADAQRRRGRPGAMLDLPATRADIGDLLGLTLETVSRVFSAFRRRDWIRLHGTGLVELHAAEALAALARGEGAETTAYRAIA
jgi:CRP/FNR family transcriptional regulator, anaerobic regulatory protein